MSVERTKIKFVESGQLIDADLDTLIGLGELLEAEELWAPARVRLLRRFMECNVDDDEWPDHSHWNWAQKAVRLRKLDIDNPLSPFRAMGLKCNGEWQGMLLVKSVGHLTQLGKPGRELLYVDYLETAPWNLSLKPIGQESCYKGVGRQLLEAAVRLSIALGFKGRIGLHSLSKARPFYRRCGITEIGPDASYHGLAYFEMTEKDATTFLGEEIH